MTDKEIIKADDCYRALSEFSYQAPVEIIMGEVQMKCENGIYEAILSQGVAVDKDELIKALKYDRNQYEKGFIDGCKMQTSAIKTEAIKEFAERLKEKGCTLEETGGFLLDVDDLDNLVKEMTEGEIRGD